jgi:hypothetical protein
MTLSAEVVDRVRRRAGDACEYCGVTATDSAGRLTIDHYQPLARGGTDDEDNLVYACFRCNTYKSDYWPRRRGHPLLWNPRGEARTVHLLELFDGRIHPVSAVGRFSLTLLHLNRPELVEYRRSRHTAAEAGNILARLDRLDVSIAALHAQLRSWVQMQTADLAELRAMLRLALRGDQE